MSLNIFDYYYLILRCMAISIDLSLDFRKIIYVIIRILEICDYLRLIISEGNWVCSLNFLHIN